MSFHYQCEIDSSVNPDVASAIEKVKQEPSTANYFPASLRSIPPSTQESFELQIGNYEFLEPSPLILDLLLHLDATFGILFGVAFLLADDRIEGFKKRFHFRIFVVVVLPTSLLALSHSIAEWRLIAKEDEFRREAGKSVDQNGALWNVEGGVHHRGGVKYSKSDLERDIDAGA